MCPGSTRGYQGQHPTASMWAREAGLDQRDGEVAPLWLVFKVLSWLSFISVKTFFFSPASLRYNWHVLLYKFTTYNIVARYTYILRNACHNQASSCILVWLPFCGCYGENIQALPLWQHSRVQHKIFFKE